MQTNYPKQIADFNRAMDNRLNVWVAASGGTEPIVEIEGKHYQMMFNPALQERAYYCFETDLFPSYDELPDCLTGRI